ncbi:MAG: heavy-metal-associated domain-containing protein [Bacteroidota bacterium]|jgi:mercuric ion binding protein
MSTIKKSTGHTLLFLFMLLSFGLFSQSINPRKTTIIIKSSVECEMCKKNVESGVSKVKGVRKVVADFNTHEIKVVYNSKKTDAEKIKKAISDLGYDADDIPANNRLNNQLKHKSKTTQ